MSDLSTAFFESAHDALVLVDAAGVVTQWNAAAAELFGTAGVGWPLTALAAPEGEDPVVRMLARALSGERVARFESRRWVQGALTPLRFRLSPLLDQGRLIGASAVIRSAQEVGTDPSLVSREVDSAAEYESDKQRFFGLTLDLLCIAGFDGFFKVLNPSWSRLLGFSEAELKAKPFIEFVHPDDRESTEKEAAGLAVGGVTISFRNRYQTVDGGWKWLHWASTADLERGLIYAAARDETEAVKLATVKDQFISTVSHELRTPLTSILGSLGLLTGGAAGEFNETADQMLGIAHRNAQRLVRLINDLLDIEKIQAGEMEFSMTQSDLALLVRESVAGNAGFAQQHQATLQAIGAEAGPVFGDAARLLQILDNLLSNAAKFSPPGGVVEVEVSRPPGRVRVEVRDRGPGVPEEFRARLFERFTQADSSDRRQRGGTGLGLSIARSVAERHGGGLGYTPRPGGGSIFWLDLPAEG